MFLGITDDQLLCCGGFKSDKFGKTVDICEFAKKQWIAMSRMLYTTGYCAICKDLTI